LAKHLDFEQRFDDVTYRHRSDLRRFARSGDFPEFVGYRLRSLTFETGTIIAVLVAVGRKSEAEKYAEEVRRESDDEECHASLDRALDGVFPPRWP
jgi:hypothetical protein